MKEIRTALNLLASQPGAGHVREDLTSRPVKFLPVYSYLIVYDPEAKPVKPGSLL
jgi:plasmid stabilization system protein ParE